MTIEPYFAFIAASFLITLAPGPDNLFVLTQSALYGPRSGIYVTLGLCTGLLVHTVAVVFGAAALFQASPVAFNGLKLIGASYLIYLAYKAFRAGASDPAAINSTAKSFKALYSRGIFMNVTNPKVSIFFLAFLPQFTQPEAGSLINQLVLLAVTFIAIAFVTFCFIAAAAGTAGQKLMNSSRAQKYLNRVAGTVFAGLAIKLLSADIAES